jgi:hypothetical protein
MTLMFRLQDNCQKEGEKLSSNWRDNDSRTRLVVSPADSCRCFDGPSDREAGRVSRACADGFIEAGRDQGLDLAEELAARGNAHERALACSLDHPEVFSAARILNHIEGLRRTSGEKRNGFPKQDLVAPESVKAELGPRIGDYYRTRDGRGAPCKVENQRRSNGSHWYFAYPADCEGEVLGYDDAGELGRRP